MNSISPGGKWLVTILGLAIMLALATGCKTVPTASVQTFAAGATSAKTQADEAFQAVNDLIAADQVDDAAQATNLSESLFFTVLDPAALAVWDNTLAKLEAYAQHLEALTSPDLTQDFVTDSENLGAQLQAFSQSLQTQQLVAPAPAIPPGIATAFTEIGSLLIREKAEHDALRIAADANASIGHALQSMADTIGKTSQDALRGTLQVHWQGRLAGLMLQFKQADEKMRQAIAGDPAKKEISLADGAAAKKAMAANFVALMQKRDAQDALLASLRRSLLNLAGLHASLAKGANLEALQFAQMIADEVKASRDIYTHFQTSLKP